MAKNSKDVRHYRVAPMSAACGKYDPRYATTNPADVDCPRCVAKVERAQRAERQPADQHRIDHGSFCVWAYNGPGKKARGFWHGDHQIDQPMWAYALRSRCGTFWETSKAKGGFDDEMSAVTAAIAAAQTRS